MHSRVGTRRNAVYIHTTLNTHVPIRENDADITDLPRPRKTPAELFINAKKINIVHL